MVFPFKGYYVVLTFESVDEILWYDHSNETYPPPPPPHFLMCCSQGAYYVVLTFETVDEILLDDHLNETSKGSTYTRNCLFF